MNQSIQQPVPVSLYVSPRISRIPVRFQCNLESMTALKVSFNINANSAPRLMLRLSSICALGPNWVYANNRDSQANTYGQTIDRAKSAASEKHKLFSQSTGGMEKRIHLFAEDDEDFGEQHDECFQDAREGRPEKQALQLGCDGP